MHFFDAFGELFCCKQPQFINVEKLLQRKHTQQEIETSYQFFETGIATLANPTISPSPESTRQREMVHLTISQRSFALIHKA